MISVVVPVYNDANGIRVTIESLLPQLHSSEANLIVVDNGSTDDSKSTLKKYAKRNESISYFTENDVQSSYAARNTGVRNTNADTIVFLDADMTVPRDWVNTISEYHQLADNYYLGCNVAFSTPDESVLAARYDRHTGFPVEHYLTQQHFAPTCCLIVRRSVFEDVGLFDPRLTSGGDKEFGNRVHDAGYDLHYAEDVTVYHPTRNSIRELAAKDRRVGRGLCQLQRYHPERYGTPGIPPRPSGAKRPSESISLGDRLAFGTLGSMLTGMRGLGYYAELVSPTPAPDIDEIPTLD